MYYNSEPFYFQKNLQGDIIAISDYWGNIVARYTYDAWGKVTSITGGRIDIANANPFRYRGYFYDVETDLYYLQSRYYDANTGRFINADDSGVLLLSVSANEYNLFAYCNNNAVNDIDESGLLSINTLCNYFVSAFNYLKNKVLEYVKSLIVFRYRMIQISTTVISFFIDSIVAAVVSIWITRAIKTTLNIILNTYLRYNASKFATIAKTIIKFLLNNFFGKIIIAKIVRYIVDRKGLRPSVKDTIASEIISNILGGCNRLMCSIYTVASSFSSIGGIFALLFDLFDGWLDGYATIRY